MMALQGCGQGYLPRLNRLGGTDLVDVGTVSLAKAVPLVQGVLKDVADTLINLMAQCVGYA